MRAAARLAIGMTVGRARRTFLVLLLCAVVAGCAQTQSFQTSRDFTPPPSGSRVLLMPPDIEISELTAAGLEEPNAAWTQSGRASVIGALDGFFAERALTLVPYRPREPDAAYDAAHLQTVMLHEAVGGAVLRHKYVEQFSLPTKKDVFDWSLGEGAAPLRTDYDADYALFPYFRESFASGGRVALIVVGALFGVGVPGGRQVAFASLVDLKTGDVVWFNTLVSGGGDLRTPEGARKAIGSLLEELPL